MIRKRFSSLLLCAAMVFVLLPVSMPAVARAAGPSLSGTVDMGSFGVDGGGTITIPAGSIVTLTNTGGRSYTNVRIVCETGVDLTLNNVEINNVDYECACALTFSGTGNTLSFLGDNRLRSGNQQPGVKVETGAALTIQEGPSGSGTNTLSVWGGNGGAGIGSGNGNDCGQITIKSGRIYAEGGKSGAGIGGGDYEPGYHGVIIIDGGNIEARGGGADDGHGGAGIGGGGGGDGGSITINGGTINAIGSDGAKWAGAGIGGGGCKSLTEGGGHGGIITINDGTITAQGGRCDQNGGGAGIGGGHCGNGGSITINNGTIIAKGGRGALRGGGAGIGGGYADENATQKGMGGNIIIRRGNIKAYGGSSDDNGGGAGIGGGAGNYGDCGAGAAMEIYGGIIEAYGGGSISGGGAGIGGGNGGYGDRIFMTNAVIKADGGAKAAGIGGGGNGRGPQNPNHLLTYASKIEINGGTITANGGSGGAGIGAGYSQTASGIFIKGGSINAVGGSGAYRIGHGADSNSTWDCMPRNSAGEAVYRTQVTLFGVNAKKQVKRIKCSIGYNTDNTYTDDNGKIYLYLAQLATATSVTTPDDYYMGNAVASNSETSFTFYTLKQNASIVPTSITFDAKDLGYWEQTEQPFAITNSNDFPTDTLNAVILGTDFEIVSGLNCALAANETATVKVRPKTGLSAGTHTGTLSIQATASTGSWLTAALSFTVNAVEPSAPQNFSVTPGNGEAALSWTAPLSDGGSAITRYEVSKDGGTSWANASSNTGHTFTGLTNGMSHTFNVRAVNSAGPGPEATVSCSLVGSPTAPTINFAIGGDGFVNLTWQAPSNDGGAAITYYEVKVGDSAWTDVGNVLTYTASGLTNGTEYTLQVRAGNRYGPGTAAIATAIPRSKIGPPSAPQNFAATPGNGQVVLNWLVPLDNGGSSITGYQISHDNGASWADVGDVLTHTYTGLNNGTEYTFQVRAVSSGVGEGAAATVTATPQAVATDKTLISIQPLAAITGLAGGTAKTAASLGLPSMVTMETSGGNVAASVVWDVNASSYDPHNSAEQTFMVDGDVTLPSGVVNPNGVSLNATISVTVMAGSQPNTHIITATADSNGSISPSGAVSVTRGNSRTFTITPDLNYSIASVTVDGVNQGEISSYTFVNVTAPHTIRASFRYVRDSSDSPHIFRTLTDSATGITVSGYIHPDAALTIHHTVLHAAERCVACDAIRSALSDHGFITLMDRDISLSHDFTGPLTITIPVGNAYDNQTITILHCANGTLHTYSATVRDGEATFVAASLSPFAAFASGSRAGIPKTGDSGGFPAWLGLMASGMLLGPLLRRRPKKRAR
ncbi:MAG: fibronectin type III domain-containing protein [Candidatus Pelethousia sp.]|nr:fibronectin type III domain-containing protein [Candidatus Pelethousia sp.]